MQILQVGLPRMRKAGVTKKSRPDPCSVDFDRETPKLRFEFCRGCFGRFFPPIFSKEKAPKKIHQKIPRKIYPGLCSEKFPSDFCRGLFFKKRFSKIWGGGVRGMPTILGVNFGGKFLGGPGAPEKIL